MSPPPLLLLLPLLPLLPWELRLLLLRLLN